MVVMQDPQETIIPTGVIFTAADTQKVYVVTSAYVKAVPEGYSEYVINRINFREFGNAANQISNGTGINIEYDANDNMVISAQSKPSTFTKVTSTDSGNVSLNPDPEEGEIAKVVGAGKIFTITPNRTVFNTFNIYMGSLVTTTTGSITTNSPYDVVELTAVINPGKVFHVKSASLNTPPTNPSHGDIYIINGAGTGDWSDKGDDAIVIFGTDDQWWNYGMHPGYDTNNPDGW